MKTAFIYHDHRVTQWPNKADIIYVYWGTSITDADAAFKAALGYDVTRVPQVGCEVKTYA